MARFPSPLLVGTALVLISTAACGSRHEVPPAAERPAIDVRTARATLGPLAGAFEAGGVVRARTSATIVARLMAPVQQVHVRPGDRVRTGQVLVTLDGRDLLAGARQARAAAVAAEQGAKGALSNREAARAALVLAQASHQRIAGLHARQSATQQELDEAVAQLRAAEARAAAADAGVEQADAGRLSAVAAGDVAAVTASYATITAPFDGIVTEKLVEPGNMTAPGMPLLRLEDTGAFRLEVRIDESRAQDLRPGQRVAVSVESGQGVGAADLAGEVTEVARAIDADARTFLVKVGLPDTVAVKSGTFGKARFQGASRQAVTVPADAIVRHGQVTSVFVVAKEHAQMRLVGLGERSGDRIEVLAGVSDGETVVVAPPSGLADGQPVRASRAAPGASQGGQR